MGQALGTRSRDELAKDRQRIAHAAGCAARDEGERRRIGGHSFGLADHRQVLLQHARGHQPEAVVEGPRPDRRDDLVRLGRREDEAHVIRWLLHELEKRVEARGGDHMGLVDDVDLVARGDGGKHRALPQLASVVDTAMAGGIQLNDVDGAGAVGCQVSAALALPARVRGGTLRAVERAGQDPGGRGLAAAAGAGQEVGVMHAIVCQGAGERLGDVLLTDDVGQTPRPVGAVEGRGHPVTLAPGADVRDPPHTRQSPPALAAFRPWGIQRGDAARGVGSSVRRAGRHAAARTSPQKCEARTVGPPGLRRARRIGDLNP